MKKLLIVLIGILFINSNFLFAQIEEKKETNKKKEAHTFEMIYQVKTTPVKSQDRTGTCWAFATTSFIETELLRMGKGEYDISEMFFVKKNYFTRAERYIRLHGNLTFGPGGQAHDVMNVIKEHGLISEKYFDGKNIDEEFHNQGEMEAVINGMLTGILKRRGKKITPRWKEAYNAVLDSYMGKAPKKFEINEEEFTPLSFRDELDFNPEDYVELTSFIHQPYYKAFPLLIPDNWRFENYYNIPLEDVTTVLDYALKNGYSICWDGDVSEKGFDMKKGYAVVSKDAGKDEKGKPEVEEEITPELRQKGYDNFTTTDDHLMHIIGLAKDQNGTPFYFTKNSWGTRPEKYKYEGSLYMSKAFVTLKMINIMVHKDAVPQEIREKCGF